MSPLTIRTLQTSQRHRVSVIGVDQSVDAIGRHFADAFSVVPNGADPTYADAVLEVAARHGADLILPCSDEEALALAAVADRVAGAGHRLACAPEATLRRMSDKAAALGRVAEALRDADPAAHLKGTPVQEAVAAG